MTDPDLLFSLGRLEGKLDAILKNQQSLENRIIDHDVRLRELESSKSAIYGVAAFVGSVAASAVSLVLYLLKA